MEAVVQEEEAEDAAAVARVDLGHVIIDVMDVREEEDRNQQGEEEEMIMVVEVIMAEEVNEQIFSCPLFQNETNAHNASFLFLYSIYLITTLQEEAMVSLRSCLNLLFLLFV